jgi:hypothetical protein
MSSHLQLFRQKYRAGIQASYHAGLHASFVALVSLAFISYQLSCVQELWRWFLIAVFVFGLVCFNFLIYFIHRDLGHVKHSWARFFYQRHTGDHHTFFSDTDYVCEQMQDFRVILFPAWLVLFVCLGGYLVVVLARYLGVPEVGHVFAAAVATGYLAYEFFHACHHLPDSYRVTRLPWFKQMREWHRLHHRRELSKHKNFNIVLPLADWVMRTTYWRK